MEKNIPELKVEFVCMCEREKATIFKVYKTCKSPIEKGF